MKKLVRQRVALLLIVMCIPALAHAQVEGNPDNWCRNGLYTHDAAGFRLGKVAGVKGARLYFYDDAEDDCPGAGAKCRKKSYLIPGDEVIVSSKFGDYVCAWFSPKKGSETVGWLKAASVSVSEVGPESSPGALGWRVGVCRPVARHQARREGGRAPRRG